MVDVTLSRSGGSSVDVSLFGGGGDLVTARDVGKPTANTHAVGAEDPRHQDYQNASTVWTVAGVLIGSSAYADAKTLAESVIKPRLSNPLTLDASALPSRSTYSVVPASESACTLTYVPGKLDVVGVQLSLAEVDSLNGGTQDSAAAQTPASGRGIRIDRGGTSVDFTVDNAVTRTVGRPGIQLNPATRELPIAIDENAPASDTFELSGVFVTSADSTVQTLEEDIVRPPLGNSTLSLEFLGNEYGLAKYDVVPTGSQSLRTSLSAGQTGIQNVPKMELRTVSNS